MTHRINDDTLHKPWYLNPYKKFKGGLIPLWILRREELSQTAKLVYGMICFHAREKGEAWMSQEKLGKAIGRGGDTAQRAIAELKQHKVIEVTPRGKGRTCLYRFLVRLDWLKPEDFLKNSSLDDIIEQRMEEESNMNDPAYMPTLDSEEMPGQDTVNTPGLRTVKTPYIIDNNIIDKEERDVISLKGNEEVSTDTILTLLSLLDRLYNKNGYLKLSDIESDEAIMDIISNVKHPVEFCGIFWNERAKIIRTYQLVVNDSITKGRDCYNRITEHGLAKVLIAVYNFQKTKQIKPEPEWRLSKCYNFDRVFGLESGFVSKYQGECMSNEKDKNNNQICGDTKDR